MTVLEFVDGCKHQEAGRRPSMREAEEHVKRLGLRLVRNLGLTTLWESKKRRAWVGDDGQFHIYARQRG